VPEFRCGDNATRCALCSPVVRFRLSQRQLAGVADDCNGSQGAGRNSARSGHQHVCQWHFDNFATRE